MSSCTSTIVPTQITLIQGEDRDLFFGVKDKEEQVFLDISLASEITVTAPSTTVGVPVVFKLTDGEIVITDGTKGKFKVEASDAKTLLLKLGELSLEITIDWNEMASIVSWQFSGTDCELTFASPHTYKLGEIVDVSGLYCATNPPNGLQTVEGVGTYLITFVAAAAPTGTPTVVNGKTVSTIGNRRISQIEKAIVVKKRLF